MHNLCPLFESIGLGYRPYDTT